MKRTTSILNIEDYLYESWREEAADEQPRICSFIARVLFPLLEKEALHIR